MSGSNLALSLRGSVTRSTSQASYSAYAQGVQRVCMFS